MGRLPDHPHRAPQLPARAAGGHHIRAAISPSIPSCRLPASSGGDGLLNAAAFSGTYGICPAGESTAAVLILLGFFLCSSAGKVTQLNLASVGQSVAADDDPARGFTITRHPFLVSVVLWGTAHILVRGDYNARSSADFWCSRRGTLLIDAKRQGRPRRPGPPAAP